MSRESDEFATKGDLNDAVSLLRSETQAMGSQLREEMRAMGAELRTEMQAMGSELRSKMQTMRAEMTKEIIGHFNFVAENIRPDMAKAKANEEEISLLDNRVTRPEQHVGLGKA